MSDPRRHTIDMLAGLRLSYAQYMRILRMVYRPPRCFKIQGISRGRG